jgi:hypothetical protein
MLSAVSGAAAVGFKVSRTGPVAAQAVVAIVTGPGLLPFPVPDATRGGKVDSPKLTVPVNCVSFAPLANASARPAAETTLNSLPIEKLLLALFRFLWCLPHPARRGKTARLAEITRLLRELPFHDRLSMNPTLVGPRRASRHMGAYHPTSITREGQCGDVFEVKP